MNSDQLQFTKKTFILTLCLISIMVSTFHINRSIYVDQPGNCTNFMVEYKGTVFFGNSEDAGTLHPLWKNPQHSQLFFYPEKEGSFGSVFVGWYWQEEYVSIQGGMNDQGLCFDLTGIPPIQMRSYPERSIQWGDIWVFKDVLQKNSNVSQVIEYFQDLSFAPRREYLDFQWMFADSSGDAVIISPNISGDLEFTRKLPEDRYLVQTNFNRLDSSSYIGKYPCPRYEAALQLLTPLNSSNQGIQSSSLNLSVDYMEEVLDAVHQHGVGAYTPYSNLFDPSQQLLYLYYTAQFGERVIINITKELTLGEHAIQISSLFSEDVVSKGEKIMMWAQIKVGAAWTGAITGVIGVVGIVIWYLIKRLYHGKPKKRE